MSLTTLIADLNLVVFDSCRLRVRLASHVAIAEANAALLSRTAATIAATPGGSRLSSSSSSSTAAAAALVSSSSSPNCVPPDPKHPNANRTLYVGNLERRVKEESLRARFARFGHIIDVDVRGRICIQILIILNYCCCRSRIVRVKRHLRSFNSPTSSRLPLPFTPTN